jgi:hypothetical protein
MKVYLHIGSNEPVIQVVGMAKEELLVLLCFGCFENQCFKAVPNTN